MKKTELGLVESINWMVEHRIWDDWYHWKLQQMPEGYADRDEKYALLYSMPEYYDWNMDLRTDEMVFRWHDSGEERVPLSVFISDHDEQPDLKMLWHSGYYDGPLSGMAEYNGEMVWFQCNWSYPPIEDIHNIIETDSHRRYALYRLSDEDREELCRHQMFRDMVGYHSDHDPDTYAPFTKKSGFDEFYEQKKDKKHRKIDPESGEVLGEVAWYQFEHYSVPRDTK